jgi:hypothetical protein
MDVQFIAGLYQVFAPELREESCTEADESTLH